MQTSRVYFILLLVIAPILNSVHFERNKGIALSFSPVPNSIIQCEVLPVKDICGFFYIAILFRYNS